MAESGLGKSILSGWLSKGFRNSEALGFTVTS